MIKKNIAVGLSMILVSAVVIQKARKGYGRKALVTIVGSFLCFLDSIKAEYVKKNRAKRIILIRHGESQGNVQPEIYERVPDSKLSLTDNGKEQAKRAGIELSRLIGKESALFFVSPFTRSLETYDEIYKTLLQEQNVECPNERYGFKEDPRIRELEWGNFQDVNKMGMVRQLRSWCGRFWFRFKDGESGADVYDRASSFLETLYRDMETCERGRRKYDNYVLVTHGLFMRLFLMRYLKWTVEEFEKVWNPGNCEMYILEKKETGKFGLNKTFRPKYADPSRGSPKYARQRALSIPKEIIRAQNMLKGSETGD